MVHMHKIQAAWEATVTTLHIDGVWGAKKDNGAVEILVSALKGTRGPQYNQLQQGFLAYLKQTQVMQKNK